MTEFDLEGRALYAIATMRSTLPFAVLAVAACKGPQPTALSAPSAPSVATATAAPAVADGAVADAGTIRRADAPLVRPIRWVCEEQYCEGRPLLAYDYLPAVDETGGLVAFVEERDGWGHTPRVGVHLVQASGRETAYLPTTTGATTFSYDEYAKNAAAHGAVVAAANAELSRYPLRPLFPLTPRDDEYWVGGKWVAEEVDGAKRRARFTFDTIEVLVTYPPKAISDGADFESLVVLQGGEEVARRTGSDLPDRPGCSWRAVKLEGVRPDVRTLALTYTNGTTSHACDGKAEPQVHHVIHW